jgi:catechol 2,3-dioxygenase-like lactoylglutathione lyase family enzyme
MLPDLVGVEMEGFVSIDFDPVAFASESDLMALRILAIDHVQVTVPSSQEVETLEFYDTVLGLERIEKPAPLLKNGGAWYRQGSIEVHLSPEDTPSDASSSKRHLCFVVADLDVAESELVTHGVEIIRDNQPITGWIRLYVRDPGGNRFEIAQRVPKSN